MKKVIFLILLISWVIIIFIASTETSNESNSKSKEIIYQCIKKTSLIANRIGITTVNDDAIKSLVEKINKPLRKCVHITIYLILSLLIFMILTMYRVDKKRAFILTIIICFCYSLTDEYHQTFVHGRTGQLSDCFLDTLGAIFGSGLLFILKKKLSKKI